VAIDLDLIRSHERYEDAAGGYSEEFLRPRLGMGETVGVLSRPLGPALPVGWVLCQSFGIEHIHLGRLNVIMARALAAAGFTVLRFDGQGYGDSELGMDVIGLRSHLEEASDAVRLVRAEPGIDRVGMFGARFGATVAALVADQMDLAYLGAVEPIVKGSRFLRDLFRRQLVSELAERGRVGEASHFEGLLDQLRGQGWADMQGFRLSSEAYRDIEELDLIASLNRFKGHGLLLSLSRSGKPALSMDALAASLATNGAHMEQTTLQEPSAGQFGEFRWRTVEGGQSKRDIQLELNEHVAVAMVTWALGHANEVEPSPDVSEVGP
jgi:hypothetical protein